MGNVWKGIVQKSHLTNHATRLLQSLEKNKGKEG
jgi:hypothetical protein